MSKYTTGELAKLCGVSVRTVQYYDSREILIPSELSEGGRRLYSEDDLKKMKIICFLRDIGFPIKSIGALFAEEHPDQILSSLLDQQEQVLQKELHERQTQLGLLQTMRQTLKTVAQVSVESIGDAAHIMKNKTKLKQLHRVLIGTAIPMGIVEWTSVFLGISQGIWWPFAAYTVLMVGYLCWIVPYYWKRVAYLCPQCHATFRPSKKNFFLSSGNFTTRTLTCPCCGRRGHCIELYTTDLPEQTKTP